MGQHTHVMAMTGYNGADTQQIIKQCGSHYQTKFQGMTGKQISSLVSLAANSRIELNI
jgi:hypothetical protein